MPKPSAVDAFVSLLALGIIAAAFYVAVRLAPPAVLQTVFVTIPEIVFPVPIL